MLAYSNNKFNIADRTNTMQFKLLLDTLDGRATMMSIPIQNNIILSAFIYPGTLEFAMHGQAAEKQQNLTRC